ncbi:MAG TPA: hypothetical protein VG734_14610 [Lacunisphaera sp.]|nr:hypothetical protein [Lacunisphaera sp.]
MPRTPETTVCEFTIEVLHGDGCVDGRNCHAELSIGTRFTAVVEYAIAKRDEPQGGYSISSEERRQFPIDCRVVGIEANRRRLDCLSSGMTARLTLEGTSRDQFAKFTTPKDNSRLFVLRSAKKPNQMPEPMSGLAPGHGSS